ncbi:hypothetical protein L3X38_004173 [Prunus dulcis]|uniref:Uncharacterized protein n=1 Tax=Prunus dulcis TaxID=3755 RepID=A0AAD4ZNH4_PRUDU|nr:hypothetical protein L3X38_004173 [Prunus dulcis]
MLCWGLEAVANCLTWHTHCFDFEGYTSTILRKNGKLSELIGELQPLFNGTGEQSEGDFYAIASQVHRLAAEVQ